MRGLGRTASIAAVVIATAGAAQAHGFMGPETGPTSLRLDLDRDGRAETFTTSAGENGVTLRIDRPGRSSIVVRDMVWSLEPPRLEAASNGSLRLMTSHVGVGRNPSEQTLTIVFRDGAYRVAGLTYGTWDRVDEAGGGSCDLNLLTGRGTTTKGPGGRARPVRFPAGGVPVTAWRVDRDLPAACRF